MTTERKPVIDPAKIPGMVWHPETACDIEDENGNPEYCVIHRPSPHHMRTWPVVLRASTLIERHCIHGIGHPDPDSLAYFMRAMPKARMDVHGCDGCCRGPNGFLELQAGNTCPNGRGDHHQCDCLGDLDDAVQYGADY